MAFCWTHGTFYRYGQCPDCLQVQVLAMPVAAQANLLLRRNQIALNPNVINQDRFGVCGTTTAVHLLAQHRLARFADLFECTFSDIIPAWNNRNFPTAMHGHKHIDFKYLARRFALWDNNAVVAPRPVGVARTNPYVAPNHNLLVDYCMSRALGYIFKKVAPARYTSEKLDFNREFDPYPGNTNYKQFTRSEGFALRTQNLAFILRDLLGAANIAIAKNTAALNNVPDAPAVVAHQNFTTEANLRALHGVHFAGARCFAVAAIFAQLINNAVAGVLPCGGWARPGGQLDFNHWVLINNYQHAPAAPGGHCAHGRVQMNIWTWGNIYNIDVCENDVPVFIQDVIYGNM